jgi:hypothetical protein
VFASLVLSDIVLTTRGSPGFMATQHLTAPTIFDAVVNGTTTYNTTKGEHSLPSSGNLSLTLFCGSRHGRTLARSRHRLPRRPLLINRSPSPRHFRPPIRTPSDWQSCLVVLLLDPRPGLHPHHEQGRSGAETAVCLSGVRPAGRGNLDRTFVVLLSDRGLRD